MYFLIYAQTFCDSMKFEYIWIILVFSRMKRTIEVKQKTFFLFFLISKVLSFILKKQTSKNVEDTIFM